MYVLYNMGKYSVRVNDETRLLEIEKSKNPMPYDFTGEGDRKTAPSAQWVLRGPGREAFLFRGWRKRMRDGPALGAPA